MIHGGFTLLPFLHIVSIDTETATFPGCIRSFRDCFCALGWAAGNIGGEISTTMAFSCHVCTYWEQSRQWLRLLIYLLGVAAGVGTGVGLWRSHTFVVLHIHAAAFSYLCRPTHSYSFNQLLFITSRRGMKTSVNNSFHLFGIIHLQQSRY
jgi:hypothetical protein